MILYQYQCTTCQREFEAYNRIDERFYAPCPFDCGGNGKLVIAHYKNQDWFKPHWNEDLDPNKPVFIESRGHFKELCKDYKVYSRALGPIDDRRGS